jgi:hypothetical protein
LNILYKIRNHKGERTIAADGFPIIIGAGPRADIQVMDLKADAEAAYIGLSQKRPFVQAGQSEVTVLYNGHRLEGSAWLMDADNLEIGSCRINFKAEGNDFIIHVISREAGMESVRPPSRESKDQALKIKPLTFRSDRRQPGAGSIIRHRRFIGLAIAFRSRFRLSRSPIKFQSAEAWLHPDLAAISCCDPANISCMPLKNVITHLKNLSRSARKKVKQSDFKWKNFRDAYPCRRTHQINRRYFSTAPGSSLTDRKWVSHRFQILK